jgi:hypothetical protein
MDERNWSVASYIDEAEVMRQRWTMMVGGGFQTEFRPDIYSELESVLFCVCDYECCETLSYVAGDCGGGAEVKL